MNWDFFEELADIPFEDRKDILMRNYGRSGPFADLLQNAPNRSDLDKIKAAVRAYNAKNDR